MITTTSVSDWRDAEVDRANRRVTRVRREALAFCAVITIASAALLAWFTHLRDEHAAGAVRELTVSRLGDSVTATAKFKVGDCSTPVSVGVHSHLITTMPIDGEPGWCQVLIQLNADQMHELSAPPS